MREKIFGGIVCILMVFLVGCATTSQVTTPPPVWPSPSGIEWYYYTPQKMASVEEAIGTIKNLEGDFVEYNAGLNFSSLEVDPYGLRAKWEWTETTEWQEYVPSTGGFFVGWTYVPTYGGSYQTRTSTEQKKDMFIIPFNELLNLETYYLPTLNRQFKWALGVALEGNKGVSIRARDKKCVYQLADALATLAMARGRDLKKEAIGVNVAPLTSKQSTLLGLLPGVGLLVLNVAIGGPAEKGGILFGDVIVEIDHVSIQKLDDLKNVISQSYQAKKEVIPVKIIRRETSVETVQEGKKTVQKETTINVEKTLDVPLKVAA